MQTEEFKGEKGESKEERKSRADGVDKQRRTNEENLETRGGESKEPQVCPPPTLPWISGIARSFGLKAH